MQLHYAATETLSCTRKLQPVSPDIKSTVSGSATVLWGLEAGVALNLLLAAKYNPCTRWSVIRSQAIEYGQLEARQQLKRILFVQRTLG